MVYPAESHENSSANLRDVAGTRNWHDDTDTDADVVIRPICPPYFWGVLGGVIYAKLCENAVSK